MKTKLRQQLAASKRKSQATDTPDTLDYEFMAEVGKLLVEVVSS